MKGDRAAPLAAALSAVISILCCLPVGIPAAIGLAGLGTLAGDLQPWLLGFAGALLAFGIVQFWRNRSCRRRSRLTIAVLCASGAIVLSLVLFPQTLAGIVADWSPGGRSTESSPLIHLDPASFARFKAGFNDAADGARIIVLLSPTCGTCLRGASAVQNVLSRNRDANVRVFVVWEPILPTDWWAPGSRAIARASDPRAVHIWDREHLIAKQMDRDARPPQPTPECCRRKKVLWDLAAFYPPSAMWGDALPTATLFNGTVVDMEQELEKALAEVTPGRTRSR